MSTRSKSRSKSAVDLKDRDDLTRTGYGPWRVAGHSITAYRTPEGKTIYAILGIGFKTFREASNYALGG